MTLLKTRRDGWSESSVVIKYFWQNNFKTSIRIKQLNMEMIPIITTRNVVFCIFKGLHAAFHTTNRGSEN